MLTRILVVLCGVVLADGLAFAQKSSVQPPKTFTVNHRRTTSSANWKNRTIRLQFGQELSIVMPPARFRPNRLLISRELLSQHGYQHVSPVLLRQKSKATAVVTWLAVAPGRESISIFHEAAGGVPQRTPFSVWSIEVTSPKEQTNPSPFVETPLSQHADLLLTSRLALTDDTFRRELGALYDRHLNTEGVTPERQHAVLTAIRQLSPESRKWFKTAPRGPIYMQIHAAALSGNHGLADDFESRLDDLNPAQNASEFNASLLAFAQLAGESSVARVVELSNAATARNERFFEEALRIATWNRFLKDAPPRAIFVDSYRGDGSIFAAWRTWWSTDGRQIDWNNRKATDG